MKIRCLCTVFVGVFLLVINPISVHSLEADNDADKLKTAYQTQQSDFFVEAEGTVIRLLDDDVKGSRHQRFILRLAHGQTLLISHNIDIAQRIDKLRTGDRISFRGEYVWNEKGGVIHWTHHDPSWRTPGGWIKHNDILYR